MKTNHYFVIRQDKKGVNIILLELKKISKLSEKLKEYIKRIEEETGRPALIKSVQDVGLAGMNAVFKLDPKYIRVEII